MRFDQTLMVTAFAIFIIAIDAILSEKLTQKLSEFDKFKNQSESLVVLKKKYKTPDDSIKTLNSLLHDISSTYFATTVSKKDFSPLSMSLNLLILNSDELDIIIKRLLNSNLKITKMTIEESGVGFMLSVEVAP